jgi:hypothetical protein
MVQANQTLPNTPFAGYPSFETVELAVRRGNPSSDAPPGRRLARLVMRSGVDNSISIAVAIMVRRAASAIDMRSPLL